jgi:hypothetical protein
MATRKRSGLLWGIFAVLGLTVAAAVASAKGKGADDPDDPDGPDPYVPKGPQVKPLNPDGPDPYVPKGPQVKPLNPDKPDEPIRVDDPKPTDPTPAEVDDVIKKYPTPGMFYQVIAGDVFMGAKGIATRALRTALYFAAKKQGMDDAAANAWAAPRAANAEAHLDMTRLIACTPINDARFGTYAFTSKSVPGAQGRAIRLLKINGDDRARILAGLSMIRNVRIGKPGDPSSVSAHGVKPLNHFELLWLPGIDLDLLFASNGQDIQPGGAWSDGSSKIHPPPKIYDLGIYDYSLSNVGVWGCTPWTAEIS